MKIRFLNASDVRTLLPMAQCTKLMRDAMIAVAERKAIQPLRTALHQEDGRGLLSMMPGYSSAPAWLGVKIVSVFPGNFGTPFGSHQGFVVLFETQHGSPVAVLDGREVTAIRTAAASAAATDVLAREDASTLAIFGYGEQAVTHIEALLRVRYFTKVLVWGRDFATARTFCEAQSARHQCTVKPLASAQEAAQEADVICTVTAAPQPFFRGEWLRAGQHVNVVGSSVPDTAEIDIETVRRSRFFVDYTDSALALAGDLRRALQAGVVGEDHILGEVGQVLTGRVAGRIASSDITLFKSLGMICEDLVAADFILKQAERLGVGQWVQW